MNYYKALFNRSRHVLRTTFWVLFAFGVWFCLGDILFDISALFWFGEGLLIAATIMMLMNLALFHPYWRKLLLHEIRQHNMKLKEIEEQEKHDAMSFGYKDPALRKRKRR